VRCESVRDLSRLSLLLLLANCPCLAAVHAQVSKWSTYEVNLTASGSASNWYIDPNGSVTATFSGPGGVTKRVNGFWDGGKSFKVRFTPTVAGTWTYQTSSSDAGLNGRTGKLTCVQTSAARHGFLRIDAKHPYSFVWDDGTRYFMWGQTYYDVVISALANDNWKEALNKSLAHGMNKVRMHVYAQTFYRPQVEFNGYPDAQPYTGASTEPNRDQLNIPYWRKLDEMVQYMASRGMVADLIITNPYWKNRMYGTDEQNDRFVKYVVSRYAAYTNVIWCVANEWSASVNYRGSHPQDHNDFDRMGRIVSANDPWKAEGEYLRPLSIHNTSPSIGFEFFDSTWPTYVANQYHNSRAVKTPNGDEWGNRGIAHNVNLARSLGRDMPLANDEYGYIGQTHPPLAVGVTMTRTMLRGAIWGIAAGGGYGSSGDMRLHPNGKGNPEITGDWLDAPEDYGDIKRMVDFFTTKGIEYWKMSSQNGLVTSGTRTYVLTETGRQYVIYAAVGSTFSLNLAAGSYNARRYDPRTGAEMSLGVVAGSRSRSFTMPDANDWVVLLTRVAGGE
jgi:Protein of unknown function (DUF4038)/Domain of unknown function (DUF5060)/Putative collagen-binding domain of a collagenase